MEWNGGMIEYAHDSRLSLNRIASHVNNILVILVREGGGVHKRGSFYKRVGCVHISTVAYTSSMGVADPSGKRGTVYIIYRPIVPSGDNYIKKLCLAHAYHSSHALNMPLSLKVADRPVYITWSCI